MDAQSESESDDCFCLSAYFFPYLFLCLLIVNNSQIRCIGQLILREKYFMLRDEDIFPSTVPLMWWFVLILS